MSQWCLHFLLAILLLCLVVADDNISTQAIESLFDSMLDSDAKLRALGTTSMVISITKNDKILFSKGYGVINPLSSSKQVPDPERTLFNIGSITKTFTATMAMQLIEQGKFNLTSNVIKLLDNGNAIVSEQIVGDLVGDSFLGLPTSVAEKPVSVWNLMTHTGGFDERVLGMSAKSATDKLPLRTYLENDMPPRIRNPGLVTTYSNHGIGLLGLIVQEQAKEPFGAYLQDKVLNRLNMTQTVYEFSPELNGIVINITIYPCSKSQFGTTVGTFKQRYL